MSKKVTGYGNRPPGRHSYGDGLLLVVSPKGVSSWVQKLVTPSGKPTMRKIGRAGPMMNLEAARIAAAELIERNKRGEVALRTEQVAGLPDRTFGGMLMSWCRLMEEQGTWSERHSERVEMRLRNYLKPLWKVPAADLTRERIIRHLEAQENRYSAGRVHGYIRECFENQIDRGLLQTNPLGRRPKSLSVPKKEVQTRPSYGLDLDALRALYAAIRDSNCLPATKGAGVLSLLTGLRTGEIRALVPEYVKADRLVLPRSIMKVKAEHRGAYEVPLSVPARKIVKVAIADGDGGLLFPVSSTAIESMFRRLSNRSHNPTGTRKSLYSWAREQGYDFAVCESLLDHQIDGVAWHYDVTTHYEARKKILARWAKEIANV